MLKSAKQGIAMPQSEFLEGTSLAEIFARLWENKDGELPRALARYIVKLRFSRADEKRMHELAVKNQQGRISASELEALDNYIKTGDLLALLQSRARRTLKKRRAVLGHG